MSNVDAHNLPPEPTHGWLRWIVPVTIILIVAGGVALWFGLPKGELVQNTWDDFETVLDKTLANNLSNFELWFKTNIIVQSTLILTAILATVFAAVTTKENTETIKKWSILLTAVTAALASVLSTFHVRENMETFIKVTRDLQLLEAEYLAERAVVVEKLKESGSPYLKPRDSTKEQDSRDVPRDLLELQRKWLPKYVEIQAIRMRAWSNVGQQSLPPIDNPTGKPEGFSKATTAPSDIAGQRAAQQRENDQVGR